MYSNVSLYALDAQTGESLSNAVMKVLSVSSPATVVTVETANELGRVDLLLPLGDYDVRLFHPGTTFGGAKRIRVVGEVDSFDLKGRRVHPMDALDPNICVVHGFFRHPNGRPYRNLDVHVIPEFTPILVQGAAVVGGPVIVRTDEQGWVRLDMFRGTVYTIEVEGYDHGRKSVYIPDAPQWNLPDLLFPRITSLRFASLPSPVQLQVGET